MHTLRYALAYVTASVSFDDSALAQLVEQMTVNHWVAGSSPAGGATFLFPEPFMAALADGR